MTSLFSSFPTDREICLAAVRQFGSALRFVPDHLKDKEMCLAATERFGGILQVFAAHQNGISLRYVPDHLKRDREISLAAVRQFGLALEFIPEDLLLDREVCSEAVKQFGMSLRFVPNELKDREMCLSAVKQFGPALRFVPNELKDRDMCMVAVLQHGLALKFIPMNLRDREMCSTAVKGFGLALEFVPEDLKDREICLTAIENGAPHGFFFGSMDKPLGSPLRFVPEHIKDGEICSKAAKHNFNAIHYLPSSVQLSDEDLVPLLYRDFRVAEHLSEATKLEILHSLDTNVFPYEPLPTRQVDLSLVNPFASFGANIPEFLDLRYTLVYGPKVLLPHTSLFESFRDYLLEETTSFLAFLATDRIPDILLDLPDNPLAEVVDPSTIKICGERSILIPIGNQVHRMKFLKSGEEMTDFLKEKIVHEFYEDHQSRDWAEKRGATIRRPV